METASAFPPKTAEGHLIAILRDIVEAVFVTLGTNIERDTKNHPTWNGSPCHVQCCCQDPSQVHEKSSLTNITLL